MKNQETPEGIIVKRIRYMLDREKGEIAELRRCSSVAEIRTKRGYFRVLKALRDNEMGGIAKNHSDNLAMAIGCLSTFHLNDEGKEETPNVMASGERPMVNEIRFQRLMQSKRVDDTFTEIRYVLSQVKDRSSAFSLARDLLWWGPKVRQDWAEKYYCSIL